MSIPRALALVLVVSGFASLSAQGQRWKVGSPLPELRLPTIGGEESVDLAAYRGKKLLLIEFASW